jgi:PAS domain S-box-containing protein
MAETLEIRSGDAVFSFDEQLVVQTWNEALERITGVPAEEAIGQPCWAVLGATTERGDLVCHAGCSNARLAREGWPVGRQELLVRGADGARRPLCVSTIRVQKNGAAPTFLHLLSEAPTGDEQEPESEPPHVQLTGRQGEILGLIAAGRNARAIALELGLAEATVRNHIRGILVAFDAHSQLEAVAKARQSGILDRT